MKKIDLKFTNNIYIETVMIIIIIIVLQWKTYFIRII